MKLPSLQEALLGYLDVVLLSCPTDISQEIMLPELSPKSSIPWLALDFGQVSKPVYTSDFYY